MRLSCALSHLELLPVSFRALNTWQGAGRPRSSELHLQVSRVLRSLAIEHCNEHRVSGLVVDIALVPKRLVLEVNGPCHYFPNTTRELEASRSRHLRLERLGWRVRCVPYFEWRALCGQAEQQAYLQELLRN